MVVLWFVPLLLATPVRHSQPWCSPVTVWSLCKIVIAEKGIQLLFPHFCCGQLHFCHFYLLVQMGLLCFYGWFSSRLAKWVALQYTKVRLCYCVIKLHQFKQLCYCKFHMRQTWLCTSSDVHMAVYLPRLGFKQLCFQTQFIAWQCECYG